MSASEQRGAVRSEADLVRCDGTRVDAVGRYEAVPRPVRGKDPSALPRDRAAIVLADGVKVYLEPLDEPRSVRGADEIARWSGVRVRVRGTARKVMPARGQSPLAPCICDITGIGAAPDDGTEGQR
jgi:hypothetical protein